ncbi:MAG: polysaccharide deacetylase family protein [Thermaceae bacterium]|uniref:polysaccharide deacetylase family protein n=2 Tax=Meiothermus granaticius TaxID=863370 RepID=UPI00119331AD|nr:polysaccharide deacetylase family protein [Meiothermus granaticius]MCL6528108.1 polysaccharide deacetylase family protein [Thermaceae bacterium]GEM86706.1 hypothetical protein MGR01S_13310 [Meiothermus granaticius NBRC 107808]
MLLKHPLIRLTPFVLLLLPAAGLALWLRHHPGIAPVTASATPPSPPQTLSAPASPIPSQKPSSRPVPPKTTPAPPPNLSAFAGTVVRQVRLPAGEKLIALTFDDGPWPVTTEAVLDILKRYQARATFFWVGKNLERYPQIARKVVEAGHAVGDHTWSHQYHKVTPQAAAKEIDSTAALIARDTETSTRLFRPPGGNLKNGLAKYALSKGYTVVMWSVSSADTDPKAPWTAFADNVLRGARPGTIVLMHDGGGDRRRTLEALPVILEGLQQQGYRFVSVPELLAQAQPQELEASRARPAQARP